MIGRLTGHLVEKQPPHVLLDVAGVAYELDVPMSTFYVLPHLGESCVLYTHLAIREDAHQLYGFATRQERDTFRELIKVSGIGPKIGLAILSGMNSDEFAQALASEDAIRLSKIPGIGKKTAERLILELRGKLGKLVSAGPLFAASEGSKGGEPIRDDILQALQALGYNEKEATAAMKTLPADCDVSSGIRQALKALAR
ncbi:Holliday junction branch migration protein RuvA [Chitinilyticum piscinae]|uniref:Holliday junction branch migration complex subunit RuvA n=1 Tax=Chitinilyticum piscinae TaxID=2866724 RepID=A0A8J7FHB0_9NEIS|nr:Holliday junction branch migration protein RuvA [Chitinilyticum piscinae]MBE9608190.1 Holliday junction branch migration protein RuvA [Chitinilyticum piscinae]